MRDASTQLPEIKMQGRSGCKLEVVKEGTRVLIKKYSCALDYNKRLLKQADKQQQFYNASSESGIFSTARVIETCSSENSLAWFSMPYLFSEKYSDYLEKISVLEVKKLLVNIVEYFKRNIENSNFEKIDCKVINSKIEEIESKVNGNSSVTDKSYFLDVLEYLQRSLPDIRLPIGNCHGDFTFSNILFGDGKIYLLDFLDSFIESPVIDIVKLRQDTCFKWSIMLEKGMPSYKKNKLIQTFNYFDAEIALFCDSYKLTDWYNYLQVFNLMRIVPYLADRDEILFIEKSLRQIV